jgi:arylamine N-acetyltransferase
VRDAALRRLHRLTALAAAGAAALVAVFAGLAASAVPGRKAGRVAARPLAPLRLSPRHVTAKAEKHRTVRHVRHVAAPAPAPAPAPPPVAPAPTPAPPVVVSGGS